jgi:uncharacterized protein (UPF0128 family)
MGEIKNGYINLVGKPEAKDHVEELGVDGRIILKRILRKIKLQILMKNTKMAVC